MNSLFFQSVTAEASRPRRWMLFLHGIFGRGSNWRGIARRLVTARPDWGAVLVDLRMHGGSQGFSPPHTLAAAVRDLEGLEARLGQEAGGGAGGEVGCVLGHSFGGKVALSYVARRAGALDQAWIIDVPPGALARTESAGERLLSSSERVLETLASLGVVFASRGEFVSRLEAAGFPRSLAEWLAMNLVREEERYRFAVDLGAIRALLDDFFTTDLWPVVEHPPGPVRLHMVIGEHSDTVGPADRRRLEQAAGTSGGRLAVHTLPTGHWVHVDDPEGLLALLLHHLA
ncbi:MAG TPA: alpha/beta hydrolase [Polyangia bacterium]|nr:alpha/beta hydrolase [Polyangia bacterium]